MTAAVAYYWAALFHGQRWMPPLFSIGLIAGILVWSPPIDESTAATMLALTFPITMWLAYSTCCIEDPGQEAVTITAAGSIANVVVARAIASAALAIPVPLLVIAAGTGTGALAIPVALAATGHLALIAAVGTGIGSLVGALARHRLGWALLMILSIAIIALVVPHAPPVRSALEDLLSNPESSASTARLQTAASIGMATVTTWLAVMFARRSG